MILHHVRHAVTLLFETFLSTLTGRKLKIWYKEHIHNWDE